MQSKNNTSFEEVVNYYKTLGSRFGYSLLLKGVKHFGYYPDGFEGISMDQAQRLMVELLARRLDLPSNSLVLDAGCGEGNVAIYLAENHSLRTKGVDILDFNIKRAKDKIKNSSLQDKVEFQVGDYSGLRFPDKTFDGLYTLETLVHSPDYMKTLREFFRALKSGGKLVLFEYSLCPKTKMSRKQRRITDIVVKGSAMHSLPHFLHGSFPKMLGEAGFINIGVENKTANVMPMLKRFYQIGFAPYFFVNLLNLQGRFINITAGVEGYENIRNGDYLRYNIIVAVKPQS